MRYLINEPLQRIPSKKSRSPRRLRCSFADSTRRRARLPLASGREPQTCACAKGPPRIHLSAHDKRQSRGRPSASESVHGRQESGRTHSSNRSTVVVVCVADKSVARFHHYLSVSGRSASIRCQMQPSVVHRGMRMEQCIHVARSRANPLPYLLPPKRQQTPDGCRRYAGIHWTAGGPTNRSNTHTHMPLFIPTLHPTGGGGPLRCGRRRRPGVGDQGCRRQQQAA